MNERRKPTASSASMPRVELPCSADGFTLRLGLKGNVSQKEALPLFSVVFPLMSISLSIILPMVKTIYAAIKSRDSDLKFDQAMRIKKFVFRVRDPAKIDSILKDRAFMLGSTSIVIFG